MLFFCFIETSAQVSYNYDDNGNRTSKVIILNTLKSDELINPVNEVETASIFDDIIDDVSIKIYPNPTKGLLRIDITNSYDIDGSIEIVNSTGKTISKTTTISETNSMDISKHPNGVYMMRIKINGETSVWKIIKE